MRISPLSSQAFNGVTLVGTVKTREPVLLDEQLKRADELHQKLIQKSKDAFLLDLVTEDVRGNHTDTISTYILDGAEARLVNQENKTISELIKMHEKNLDSDAFVISLNNLIAKLIETQKKVATFIALNYPTDKLRKLKPFIK